MSVDEIGTNQVLNFSIDKIFTIDGSQKTYDLRKNQGVNNHFGG